MRFQTQDDINPQNRPSLVTIFPGGTKNGVQLPPDTLILLNGEKVIAESKILDGVMVFERVSRKPFDINLEFTIRQQNQEINTALPNPFKYIFPQDKIEDLIGNIWNVNEVVQIQNTYLNGIGINEIIIKTITFTTIRGNTNVLGSMKCLENYIDNKGGTLVIPL